ncbi:DNA/RNA-binding domain E.t1.c1-type [Penicillium alfredii]|uniref:DNA/RNA-binding domain E.t1.c1-type n=1 Tax=Penicillium alfredii TaxID=1506179 RepID=A0A9W9FRU5_9EURO|nr:DNA/RNA-binding domain E.t1.c1-type [Penicillium alfredii]KAJ5104872.1 DNA/RNA-binding domain E.t1.c1-type [Penicillium alfredii]
MANRVCWSASPTLSNSRQHSTGIADDGTWDTLSSQGARAVKGSPRANVAFARKPHRQGSFRVSRDRRRLSASPSKRLGGYCAPRNVNEWVPQASVSAAETPGTLFVSGEGSRPEFRRFHSSPIARHSPHLSTQVQDGSSQTPHPQELLGAPYLALEGLETDPGVDKPHEMFRQPDTNPITEDQLVHEVRGIYAGLVMVEKKCIEVDKQQSDAGPSKADLSPARWQAMISLHQTLLYEHHDFFLASQHPSASPVLKRLAEKYAMPARMWRYGIHSFLELLRQKLPASLDYMLSFIYLAYSMMTLLLESVPAFEETWIECLGDLARYRMAVEEVDLRDREVWAGVSRYWYNKDADRSPEVGRIQHHLAVLARPDTLQQLFYYTKALVSVRPFPNARESIILLFNTQLNDKAPQRNSMITAFVAAHGVLFTRGPTKKFVARANEFLSLLRKEIDRLARQGQQGVYLMSCNFAAMLQYGEAEAPLILEFAQKQPTSLAEAHASAITTYNNAVSGIANDPGHAHPDISSQLVFQGSSLAFHTLSVILGQIGDPKMYPSAHISLSFIWCLALHPPAMQRFEAMIPWTEIVAFLSTLLRPDTMIAKIENESFPLLDDGSAQQLPEDFLIRGQLWSQLYYPENFFKGAPIEDDRPSIEEPSAVIPRRHRCLWLGVRIATLNRWMSYDSTACRFEATQLAHEYAPMAENCGQLNSKTQFVGTEETPSDLEMTGV